MSPRTETVTTADGPFDLPVWLPEVGHGPGILLIQEIYGVSATTSGPSPKTSPRSGTSSRRPTCSGGSSRDIDAPIQFHFGGSDPFIPRDQVAQVEQAVQASPNAEIHVEPDAGHAFHNRKAPMFHNPPAAARAWHHTKAIPVSPPPRPSLQPGLTGTPEKPVRTLMYKSLGRVVR